MSPSIKLCIELLIVIPLLAVSIGCSEDTVCPEPEPEPEPSELVIGIAYHDTYNKDLRYVEKTGKFWGQPEVVQYGGCVGQHSSLALDAQGNPHISYFDFDNAELKYAVRDENGWHRFTVDCGVGCEDIVGNRCSIALDAQGNPHISYMDETSDLVKYAWNTTGYWETTTVPDSWIWGGLVSDCSPPDWGHPTSIAIDAGGTPHISYYSDITHNLAYITKINNEWDVKAADQSGDVGMGCSLVLDAQGSPHISYMEYVSGTDIRLKYARWVDGEWVPDLVPVVDPVNDCMFPTTIAVADDGTVHICYLTDPKGSASLGYAEKLPGGEWEFDVVDAAGNAGMYCSLALDAQGNPHVSYWYDFAGQYLKYAVRIDNKWHNYIVDDAPGVGLYSSIALRYR